MATKAFPLIITTEADNAAYVFNVITSADDAENRIMDDFNFIIHTHSETLSELDGDAYSTYIQAELAGLGWNVVLLPTWVNVIGYEV